jgi:hypothetical protein
LEATLRINSNVNDKNRSSFVHGLRTARRFSARPATADPTAPAKGRHGQSGDCFTVINGGEMKGQWISLTMAVMMDSAILTMYAIDAEYAGHLLVFAAKLFARGDCEKHATHFR